MYSSCVVCRTSDFIGKRWTIPILLELYKGPEKKRYSEIKNSMPEITPKILSARLKELEKEKMIKKSVDTAEFPIKCEYSLTESGNEFISIIKNIKKWSLKNKFKNRACENQECHSCGL